MDTEQVQELVRRVKIGDEAAFAELYDEFADRLYAFIRIKTSGLEEAEDILQEVFLKAWKGSKNLDSKDLNFSAWMYRITSNTINDYYRKKYASPQTVAIEEAAELAGKESTTKETELGFSKEAIGKALDELPQHYKQIIELRFFQELSIIETAEVLQKNSVTVRVWQHRAVKQLEQIFKRNERTT